MNASHTPSTVWPTPGESTSDYLDRLKKLGIPPHTVNIDG